MPKGALIAEDIITYDTNTDLWRKTPFYDLNLVCDTNYQVTGKTVHFDYIMPIKGLNASAFKERTADCPDMERTYECIDTGTFTFDFEDRYQPPMLVVDKCHFDKYVNATEAKDSLSSMAMQQEMMYNKKVIKDVFQLVADNATPVDTYLNDVDNVNIIESLMDVSNFIEERGDNPLDLVWYVTYKIKKGLVRADMNCCDLATPTGSNLFDRTQITYVNFPPGTAPAGVDLLIYDPKIVKYAQSCIVADWIRGATPETRHNYFYDRHADVGMNILPTYYMDDLDAMQTTYIAYKGVLT